MKKRAFSQINNSRIEKNSGVVYVSSESSRIIDDRKGLGNYVHLSFTKNHPMMHVRKRTGQRIALYKIDLSVVDIPGTRFSDVNAARNDAIILDTCEHIHFPTVLRNSQFDLPECEKQYYHAEVLVLTRVAPEHFERLL